jgi:hypothetical protein
MTCDLAVPISHFMAKKERLWILQNEKFILYQAGDG